MQTRARAKTQTVPSPGNPVIPLEGSGSRPPSMASEDEGDLGLVSLLGGGVVSDVGENYIHVSASSGPGDDTVVAAQVEVTSSSGHVEVWSTDQLPSTVRTTRLPDLQAQAPVGATQDPPLSLSRGSEPMQLPSLHPGVEARIPTIVSAMSVSLRYSELKLMFKCIHESCRYVMLYTNKNWLSQTCSLYHDFICGNSQS